MIKKHNIVWSPQAEISYLKIIKYLLDVWTLKEALAFEEKIESHLDKLKIFPKMCPNSEKQKKIRRCVITSQTSLAYRITENSIELITFFDNRSKHNY